MVGRLLLIPVLFVATIFLSGCYHTISADDQAKARIKEDLVGRELEYSNIAGDTLVFVVKEEDIKSIEKTTLDKETVWKVRVGESLAWDIYYDSTGTEIVKEEQLFVS